VWKAAETRWLNQGISNDDFHAMIADDCWPFGERIAERGFPFIASRPAFGEENPRSRIEETLHQIHQIPPSRMRAWLAALILQQLVEYRYREIPVTITLADYQELFRSALDPTLTPAGTFSQMSGEAVYGIVRRYGIVGSIHSHNS
jgi:hypothetical protein